MTLKPASVLRAAVLLAALLTLALPSAGFAGPAGPDDNIPGAPITSSPVSDHLDSVNDSDDVRSIWLEAGDTLYLTLDRTGTFTPGFTPYLYLYAPGTTAIHVFSPIQHAEGVLMPKSIAYVAPWTGTYYIDMYAPVTDPASSGDVRLTWSVLRPVFRFYNMSNGTHFYTPNVGERDTVIGNWPHIYRYEGAAYTINPYNNTQPLYRFYNLRSGSHFYTASPAERNHVIATWPTVLRYEGETYAVNPGWVPNSITVYRFYNLRNGSHFFTASDAERDTVIANWPTIYRYEGPAFYLGQ